MGKIKTYEMVYILDPDLEKEDLGKINKLIETWIKREKGDLVHISNWGKQKLAYKINKKQYGSYFYMVFHIPKDRVSKLQRRLNIKSEIMRYLIVMLDPDEERYVLEKIEKEKAKAKTKGQ